MVMSGPTVEQGHESAHARLVRDTGASGWPRPEPASRYDLVVVGGGTAGLVSAMGAAGLGARVALVERALLGGDCLHTGCVPSKAWLRTAHAVGALRGLDELGVSTGGARVDFARVVSRMRERQSILAPHDGTARLRQAGVDVFFGHGRFADGGTLQVADLRLRFRRAVVATGGRPQRPSVPGLDALPVLTSETVFDLTRLPERLIVVGAGPIGCELGQAFARFGSRVTLVDRAPRVLPREEADTARLVQAAFVRDGMRLLLDASLVRAARDGTGVSLTVSRRDGGEESVTGDALLLAAGRAPNIENLGLDAAGVEAGPHGIVVNDRLQTTNPRIYAAGDVCSAYQFTHAADAQARLVLQNAFFFGHRRASRLVMPWVTYTDPEVAHVGTTAAEAAASDGRIQAITVPFDTVDRAVVDGETDGFVRVFHARGRLRGCTIVGAHAGELIAEAAYAITHGGTLGQLSATVHPYPTRADALRKAGDAYRRQSLTPALRRWLERYFRWTRG